MGAFELHLENLPRTVELLRKDGRTVFRYIDQRRLPQDLVFEEATTWQQVVDAIKTLAVRGAPAIGVSGAAALALWAAAEPHPTQDEMHAVAEQIADARPTAVNLRWGVQKALKAADALFGGGAIDSLQLADTLFNLVKDLERADEAANRAIGRNGAALLQPGSRVLTHCNAGSLATVFYGTALGVIYAAAEQGKIALVYADETRPVGQGARLTAWELARAGVPVVLQCDNMAASTMAQGLVDAVIVGADRIAANGDAANKIGTYGVAILAKEFGIPFYIAAPVSTIDLSIAAGSDIVIEQRSATEVLAQAIPGVQVLNPAFDVTPARYIAGIITERGVFAPQDLAAALAADVSANPARDAQADATAARA